VIKLFLPQSTLEEWAAEGRADLKDGKLLVESEQAVCRVAPAVHFQRLASGSDSKKLLATVKTTLQLEQMGAEQMSDSVILGEDAYDVVQGYVAEVASASDAEKGKETHDADLLAAFLLDKMT
jgi:hypothetical protein